MVEVPQVDTGHPALEVHFSVLVESRVGINLQLSQPLAGHGSVLEWRIVLIAPWGPGKRKHNKHVFVYCRILVVPHL